MRQKNPCLIETARAAHGKRVAQKFESPSILERLPEETMTMSELSEWYLEVFGEKVKIENRKVSGETLRVFKSRKVKRLLRGAANARDRTEEDLHTAMGTYPVD